MAPASVDDLIPFVHVADVERSIGFYERLGFRVAERLHEPEGVDWALLKTGDARVMLARATAAVDPKAQAVLFYLYTTNLRALREDVVAGGVESMTVSGGVRSTVKVAGALVPTRAELSDCSAWAV